jgi:hypothetical protein
LPVKDTHDEGAGETDITLLVIIGLPEPFISIPKSWTLIILFLIIAVPQVLLAKIPLTVAVIKFLVIIGEHGYSFRISPFSAPLIIFSVIN